MATSISPDSSQRVFPERCHLALWRTWTRFDRRADRPPPQPLPRQRARFLGSRYPRPGLCPTQGHPGLWVLLVEFPPKRVFDDVAPGPGQLLIVPNKVLEVVALPDTTAWCPASRVDSPRGYGLVGLDDRTKRVLLVPRAFVIRRGEAFAPGSCGAEDLLEANASPLPWRMRIPCMWLGITIHSSSSASGKCCGISSQHPETISPIGLRYIAPSSIPPNRHARPREQIVTKYPPEAA
jgi:hypothetical protein